MLFWHGEDREVLMQLRLSVLTGEHANYSQIITKRSSNQIKKQNTIAVYLDFSKAFNTVNHDILMSKLLHNGIKGVMHLWFKSYLSNRKQYVSIKNCSSSMSNITLGVSQGSVLGPVLFLLYINDMHRSSNQMR